MTAHDSQETSHHPIRKLFGSLPPLLWTFWIVLVALGCLTVLTQFYFSHTRHPAFYPFSSPLFQDYSHHFDFLVYKTRFQHFHQASFFNAWNWPYSYPASMAVIYKIFYATGPRSLGVFLTFSALSYLIATSLFTRALAKAGIAPLAAICFTLPVLFFSYPARLQIFLANMEVMVFVVLTLGIWAYATKRDYLASACFAIAASFKIFPFVFLALFYARRQYRQLLFGIAVLLGVTVASLWILGPTLATAYHGIQAGVASFQQIYVNQFNPLESGMDHSLFGLIKIAIILMVRKTHFVKLAGPYLLLTATAGVVLYFLRIRHLPATNQVLVLGALSVLLPPVSHDYTLLNLYGPWAMLVLAIVHAARNGVRPRGAKAMLLCFAILFTAQNYLIFPVGVYDDLRVAGQLKAITLLVLCGLALRYPLTAADPATEPAAA
jgi:hypothetical protein